MEELRGALSELAVSPGYRNLMRRVPAIASLANSPKTRCLLGCLREGRYFPVRSIIFDKTPDANWLVPWHQDMSIAVANKREVQGYGPWSIKDGVPHVQPPLDVLDAMVTLRFHLDGCDESNGTLRVIPGSHRLGRMGAGDIAKARREIGEVAVSVRAGDVLMMRPLLLHASSEARVAGHRRVIHLEYASSPLPCGLEWAEAAAD